MKSYALTTIFAIFLTFTVVAPCAFFVAPPVAYAQLGVPTDDFITQIKSTITAIETTLIDYSTAATWMNQNILQPIAFIKSGALLKTLTAGVIKFVTGTANGTGVPQFVANTQKSLQQLSDMKAHAYLSQMGLTGSPFASSIAAALGLNYSYGTSLGGFWAANMNTLRAGSAGISNTANIPAYLAGSWLQGGVAAWLALTTVPQNNPYMLYQRSQAQMAKLIGPGAGGATGARLSELSWGKGMMSWCGTSNEATAAANASVTSAYQACMAECSNTATNPGGYTSACANHCTDAFSQNGGTIAASGVNPGDACTQSDGTAGTIKTPGSVISDSLTKVLGVGPDKLVQMGNIGTQLSGILGSIANIMGTINLAKDILSGPSNGGLLGADNSPALSAPNPNNPNDPTNAGLGVIATSTVGMASTTGMSARLPLYKTSWSTISTAAITASTNVNTLISTCTTASTTAAAQITVLTPLITSDPTAQDQINQLNAFIGATAVQISAARAALTQEIAPVFTLVTNAASIATAATAMLQKPNPTSDDILILNSMSPTASEAATAQGNATASGRATATPPGSLMVASSSSVPLIDQMNLIGTNAAALKTCVYTYIPPPVTM
jgi:hypothetical protein